MKLWLPSVLLCAGLVGCAAMGTKMYATTYVATCPSKSEHLTLAIALFDNLCTRFSERAKLRNFGQCHAGQLDTEKATSMLIVDIGPDADRGFFAPPGWETVYVKATSSQLGVTIEREGDREDDLMKQIALEVENSFTQYGCGKWTVNQYSHTDLSW